jgi:hypothetical protein
VPDDELSTTFLRIRFLSSMQLALRFKPNLKPQLDEVDAWADVPSHKPSSITSEHHEVTAHIDLLAEVPFRQ